MKIVNISITPKSFLVPLCNFSSWPLLVGLFTCISFLGLPYKIPHTGWFGTTEVHSLTVPEATSSESSCHQGLVPSGDSERESVSCFSPSFLVVAGNLAVSLFVHTSSQSLSSHGLVWSLSTHKTYDTKYVSFSLKSTNSPSLQTLVGYNDWLQFWQYLQLLSGPSG